MYLPTHFEQRDRDVLLALVRDHPLAAVVTSGPEGLTADHLPLAFDAGSGGTGALVGHVARANPLWRTAAGTPVLAVFRGPQAYVSPNWYPSKATAHRVVPTWNYLAVHVHGTLEVVDDADWLRALVGRLTEQHEAAQPAPWSIGDAPPEFVRQMLRAIVGIRIPVRRMLGKWKASQNRDEADREGVAAGLAAGAHEARAMAAVVRHCSPTDREEPT